MWKGRDRSQLLLGVTAWGLDALSLVLHACRALLSGTQHSGGVVQRGIYTPVKIQFYFCVVLQLILRLWCAFCGNSQQVRSDGSISVSCMSKTCLKRLLCIQLEVPGTPKESVLELIQKESGI